MRELCKYIPTWRPHWVVFLMECSALLLCLDWMSFLRCDELSQPLIWSGKGKDLSSTKLSYQLAGSLSPGSGSFLSLARLSFPR